MSLVVFVFVMEGWGGAAALQLKEFGKEVSLGFTLGGGTSRTRLDHAVADFRAGRLNPDDFDASLVMEELPSTITERLGTLGDLKTITPLSAEGSRAVYQVTFDRGNTIWLLDFASNGKISHLSVQF